MDMSVLNNIQLNPKEKGSINYVKARCAIESAAKSRSEKRQCKQAVIEFLKGEILHNGNNKRGLKIHNIVKFPDGSKARY